MKRQGRDLLKCLSRRRFLMKISPQKNKADFSRTASSPPRKLFPRRSRAVALTTPKINLQKEPFTPRSPWDLSGSHKEGLATSERAERSPSPWVKMQSVLYWLRKEGIDVQRSLISEKIFYLLEDHILTPSQLVLMANRQRLLKKLQPFFIENLTVY